MASARQKLLAGVAGLSLAFGVAAQAQQRGSAMPPQAASQQNAGAVIYPQPGFGSYYGPRGQYNQAFPPPAPHTAPRVHAAVLQQVTLATSTPDLDRKMADYVARITAAHGFHAARAAPQVEAEINGMLGDLRRAVPGALPEARAMADHTQIYVIPGEKNINMTSATIRAPDGHAVNAILITQGALEKLGRPEFKAALGHEFAHHLFLMNPALLYTPRYEPKSAAYQDERARSNFTPTAQEIQNFKQGYAQKFHTAPAQNQVLGYIRDTAARRAAMYKEEAMADKVGLRLTKDVYAAQAEQLQLAANHLMGGILQYGQIDQRGNPDPHPSTQVRLAENLQTAGEMGLGQPQRAVAARPAAPGS